MLRERNELQYLITGTFCIVSSLKYLREHVIHCTLFSINALSYIEIYSQSHARRVLALIRVSVQDAKVLGIL